MTERQQLRAMLQRAGIAYETIEPPDGKPAGATDGVRVESGCGWPSNGYPGFFTEWWFDENGLLIGVGTWE